MNKINIVCGLVALVSIIWIATGVSAKYVLALSTLGMVFGGFVSLEQAWNRPREMSKKGWWLLTLAAIINLLLVDKWGLDYWENWILSVAFLINLIPISLLIFMEDLKYWES
jgi:hypothetical protein